MPDTTARMHVALNVEDLDRSRAFYQDLFDVGPDKERPGYVRFQPGCVPLTLTLGTEGAVEPGNRLSHMGIRVADGDALKAARARLEAAGHELKVQEGTTCCHALQDKFWIIDPDGNHWEFYELIDDLQEPGAEQAAMRRSGKDDCCS